MFILTSFKYSTTAWYYDTVYQNWGNWEISTGKCVTEREKYQADILIAQKNVSSPKEKSEPIFG